MAEKESMIMKKDIISSEQQREKDEKKMKRLLEKIKGITFISLDSQREKESIAQKTHLREGKKKSLKTP